MITKHTDQLMLIAAQLSAIANETIDHHHEVAVIYHDVCDLIEEATGLEATNNEGPRHQQYIKAGTQIMTIVESVDTLVTDTYR